MKRYLISVVTVLVVLAVACGAFAQDEERTERRERWQSMSQRFENMSEEEREKFRAEMRQRRERYMNMSEEEREKFRAETRQRRERYMNMSEEEREKLRAETRERGGFGRGGFMGREGQLEAIKAIEAQLAKLKATQTTRPAGGYRDLSEDERAKLRERMTKIFQDRQKALQTIIAQVARLQGRRRPAPEAAEGVQYLIINTSDLKPIQAAAVKEKAKETTQLLQRLIARASGRRGFGGRPGTGQRPQGGQRRPRGPRTPGDREDSGRQRNR